MPFTGKGTLPTFISDDPLLNEGHELSARLCVTHMDFHFRPVIRGLSTG